LQNINLKVGLYQCYYTHTIISSIFKGMSHLVKKCLDALYNARSRRPCYTKRKIKPSYWIVN